MFVNDIVIIGDDKKRIDNLEKYLQKHFQPNDLGSLKYFVGIDVVRSKKGHSSVTEEIYTRLAFRRWDA